MIKGQVTFDTLQSLPYMVTAYRVGFLAYDEYEDDNEFVGDELEALFLSQKCAMEYAKSVTRDDLERYMSELDDEKIGIRVQLEICEWYEGRYDYVDILTVNEFDKES